MSNLILIRGIPGSGKSTIAKEIKDSMDNCFHLEADMWFMKDGTYMFNKNLLHHAHSWCLSTTEILLSYDNDVIVSNTFTTQKEIKKYIDLTYDSLTIIDMKSNYSSIHNVSEETLKKMRDRYSSVNDVKDYILRVKESYFVADTLETEKFIMYIFKKN